MRYLLDTNVFVAAMARRDPIVMTRMADKHRQIDLSAIVLHELYYGAFNSADAMRERNLTSIAGIELPVLTFDADDAQAAGELRARLKRGGTPISGNDLLIAGQALARGLVMVTANVREFTRVEGLRVEDWTAA